MRNLVYPMKAAQYARYPSLYFGCVSVIFMLTLFVPKELPRAERFSRPVHPTSARPL